MKIRVITEHTFDLPYSAKPEDILIIGENTDGDLVIDYRGDTFHAKNTDCYDMQFIEQSPKHNKTHPNYDNAKAFDELSKSLPDFYDSSWKNDTCPSLHKWVDEDAEHYIQIFIDYKNPELREHESFSEFLVTIGKEGVSHSVECHSINDVMLVLEGVNCATQ